MRWINRGRISNRREKRRKATDPPKAVVIRALVGRWLAVSFFVALAAGPWVFAVRRGTDALGLLGFGIVFGCCYASFFGVTGGAIVGIASLFYLGPFLTALAPFVTSKGSLLALVAASGFVFMMIWTIAVQVAAPDLSAIADAEDGEKKDNSTINALRVLIPMLSVFSLQGLSSVHLQDADQFLALSIFLVSNLVFIFFFPHRLLNFRPAGLFFKRLAPLLVAMRGGLISFAIGYGFTAFCFAGVYAALYRIDPANFSISVNGHPTMWDFIYFSLTTITTIGLSDIKPAFGKFAPQAVVSTELIVGIFWVVIYFAIAMTLLQVSVRDLLERLHKSQQDPPEPSV
jgi:Ion channel